MTDEERRLAREVVRLQMELVGDRARSARQYRDAIVNIGTHAHIAAQAVDVAHYDRDSYIAGYQDACVNCDDALRTMSDVPQPKGE